MRANKLKIFNFLTVLLVFVLPVSQLLAQGRYVDVIVEKDSKTTDGDKENCPIVGNDNYVIQTGISANKKWDQNEEDMGDSDSECGDLEASISGIEYLVDLLAEKKNAQVEMVQEIDLPSPTGTARHLLKVESNSRGQHPVFYYALHDKGLSASKSFNYILVPLNRISGLEGITRYLGGGHFGSVFEKDNTDDSTGVKKIVKLQFLESKDLSYNVYKNESNILKKLQKARRQIPNLNLAVPNFYGNSEWELSNLEDSQIEVSGSAISTERFYKYNLGVLTVIEQEQIFGEDFESFLEQAGISPENPFPLSEVKEVADQLSRTLKFLHKHKIFHRDLRAANIMVSLVKKGTGEVLKIKPSSFYINHQNQWHLMGWELKVTIIDFGIAIQSASSASIHVLGEYKGGYLPILPPQMLSGDKTYISNFDTWALSLFLIHLTLGDDSLIVGRTKKEKGLNRAAFCELALDKIASNDGHNEVVYGPIGILMNFLTVEHFSKEVRVKDIVSLLH